MSFGPTKALRPRRYSRGGHGDTPAMAMHDTSHWLAPPAGGYGGSSFGGLSQTLSLPTLGGGVVSKAKAAREFNRSFRPQPSPAAQKALRKMVNHLIDRKSSLNLLFRQFDADGSGEIDLEELYMALQSVGLRLSMDDAKHILAELDADGDGSVSLPEFMDYFKRERAERRWGAGAEQRRSEAPSPKKEMSADKSIAAQVAMNTMIDHLVERKANLTLMFRECDKDGSGDIDVDELKLALGQMGLRMQRKQVELIMDELVRRCARLPAMACPARSPASAPHRD